jgi:hypothetical protein
MTALAFPLVKPLRAQIFPARVHRFDQLHLLLTSPTLELLLALDGRARFAEVFKVKQVAQAVVGTESGHGLVAMLPKAALQVVRHPDLERAAVFVRDDVNEVVRHAVEGGFC